MSTQPHASIPRRVGVFGAGAIGGFLGISLSAIGVPITLVGRGWILRAGSRLEAIDSSTGLVHAAGPDLVASDDASVLRDVDLCLVTVKSRDTDTAADMLMRVLPRGVPVVSLQNGLHNAEHLTRRLEGSRPVVAGVVGFNAVLEPPTHVVRVVHGNVLLGRPDDASTHARIAWLARALTNAGTRTVLHRDIDRVIAGKLLVNLVNGVSGATGLGVAGVLFDPDARRCYARCLHEGREILRTAGRPAGRVAVLGPRMLEAALSAPTWFVRIAARKLASVDPRSRPSTLQDLDRGRVTEIEALNGEIVRLAHAHGLEAPYNATVTEAVHAHEARVSAGQTPEWLTPAELRDRIETHKGTRDPRLP